MNFEEIIANVELHFLTLTDECRRDLKKVSKIMTLERETLLVKEGQLADKTYFIAKGSARAFYLKDDKDITDWFAFENNFINSINSFFLHIPSPHFIEVLEPSILLEISRENIDLLSDRYQEFDRLGKIAITKTLLQLQQRVVSIQFETAQQKYENILQIRPDITQRVALTHIASYLGITLETLSRIRNPKKRI
ncbi:MAG: cAMP-binding protein [Fluviicola sp.]|jgi:CRP-like cAMP-binding protein|uniref:Crp/Fnr family transcriptional regulator n=1 Tax=Fluviicola sp. TaxID=1917219 RepID=UPI002619E525|nr:Crp/Fnr family transcriptional regulator [Fluviicola sp.]MDF3026002.1 cAMP-binding protein [Fluviicola sp.]